jgi:hypothetical protein
LLTWETTLRLVRTKDPSPILVGLVLQEIEDKIEEIKGMSSFDDVAFRGLLLKRFYLHQKLTRMLASGATNTQNRGMD